MPRGGGNRPQWPSRPERAEKSTRLHRPTGAKRPVNHEPQRAVTGSQRPYEREQSPCASAPARTSHNARTDSSENGGGQVAVSTIVGQDRESGPHGYACECDRVSFAEREHLTTERVLMQRDNCAIRKQHSNAKRAEIHAIEATEHRCECGRDPHAVNAARRRWTRDRVPHYCSEHRACEKRIRSSHADTYRRYTSPTTPWWVSRRADT